MAVNGSDRARWIRRGETVHVSGVALFTGLFYVGKTFGDPLTWFDRYAINPSLPVGRSARDYIPAYDPVGCSYEQLPPSGRRAYLEWLSGSCRNTDVPPQFVNLYCGGLFIRVFLEGGSDRDTVMAEARRLLVLHKENKAFVALLGDLIAIGSALDAKLGVMPTRQPEWRASAYVAGAVVIRIAELIAAKRNVGADDAFLYACERAKLRNSKPLDIDGVRLLWKRKYIGRFSDGCYVEPPAQPLKLVLPMPDKVKQLKVRPPVWASKLPDPAQARGFCEMVDTMYEDCVREMDGYSRLMRKSPGAAGSLEAVSVLPKQLVATTLAGRFASVKEALDSQLAKQGITFSSVQRLFEFMELPFKGDEEITPSVRKLLSVAMDKMDIGFEPDARYGAVGFFYDGNIVFFRGENGTPVKWDGPYAVHRACADFVLGHVCLAGQFEAAEAALYDIRRNDRELTDEERIRLGAHARSLIRNSGVRKGPPFKQSRIDASDMVKLGGYVSVVVSALSELGVDAISKTEKYLRKVGFDVRDFHAALHRKSATREGLVSVVAAEPSKGRSIPAPPKVKAEKVPELPRIDLEKLREIEEDTVLVSGLLNDIFSEEAPIAPSEAVSVRDGELTYMGLDAAHSELLAAVMAAVTMPRKEFEALAREKKLMPDGALENINDMAFDMFGEPVLVDEGNVIFEDHLRAELEKTRVSA